ncbi:Gldg family protein [Spirochaetia bacterium 38H-sp]|uniref:Gldg family protein n=1 Tax=Rarispira pelagica TaxID=3141764 RepID=A0ABU9UDQ7_9SPIR
MLDFSVIFFLVRREVYYFFKKPVFYVWTAVFTAFSAIWAVFFRHIFAIGLSSFSFYLEALSFLIPVGLAFFLASLYRGRDARQVAEFFYSLPVSSYEIVAYRYISAVFLMFFSLLFCVPFFIMFCSAGTFYVGELFSVLIAIILMVVFFAALNSFLIRLYDNPAFSLIFTIFVDFILLFIAALAASFNLPPSLSSLLRFFSPTIRFLRLADAYVALADVMWFFLLSLAFLLFLHLYTEKKRGTRINARSFSVQLLVFLILLLAHSSATSLFFDLSHKRRHTLADVTHALLRKISAPLYIDYYYSDFLETQSPVPEEILSHLRLYTRYSNQVVLRTRKLSGRDEDAERLGIVPQQVESSSASSISYSTVYSGISISYLDKVWVIPVAYEQRLLQYQIASALDALLTGKRPVVGVFTRETGDDYKKSYVSMVGFLARGFDVVAVGPDRDKDFDILIVVDRGSMSDTDVSFIASAIKNNKSVLFAVDSIDIDPQDYFAVKDASDSPLMTFLGHLGIKAENKLIALPPGLNIPLLEEGESSSVSRLVEYPLWLDIKYAQADLPWAKWFSGLHLYWSSPLRLTSKAWKPALVTPPAYSIGMDKSILPGAIASPYGERDISYVVSAVYQSDNGQRMLIVSDADFLSDLSAFTSAHENMDFLLSACTWLAGKDKIIPLVVRDSSVEKLKISSSEERAQIFIFLFNGINIFFIPFILLVIATVIYVRGYNGKKD